MKQKPNLSKEEVDVFEMAQNKLMETASNDKALLAEAQQRAQSLLEDYVTNIGNAAGKGYSIKWIYVDAGETRYKEFESETVSEVEGKEY